jgi:hypothetical protein
MARRGLKALRGAPLLARARTLDVATHRAIAALKAVVADEVLMDARSLEPRLGRQPLIDQRLERIQLGRHPPAPVDGLRPVLEVALDGSPVAATSRPISAYVYPWRDNALMSINSSSLITAASASSTTNAAERHGRRRQNRPTFSDGHPHRLADHVAMLIAQHLPDDLRDRHPVYPGHRRPPLCQSVKNSDDDQRRGGRTYDSVRRGPTPRTGRDHADRVGGVVVEWLPVKRLYDIRAFKTAWAEYAYIYRLAAGGRFGGTAVTSMRQLVRGLGLHCHPSWQLTEDEFADRDRYHTAVRPRLRDLQAMGLLRWRADVDDEGEERRTELELLEVPELMAEELEAAAERLARWEARDRPPCVEARDGRGVRSRQCDQQLT